MLNFGLVKKFVLMEKLLRYHTSGILRRRKKVGSVEGMSKKDEKGKRGLQSVL